MDNSRIIKTLDNGDAFNRLIKVYQIQDSQGRPHNVVYCYSNKCMIDLDTNTYNKIDYDRDKGKEM